MNSNQFTHLSAENPEHRLAQVGSHEQVPYEFDAWLAEGAAQAQASYFGALVRESEQQAEASE